MKKLPIWIDTDPGVDDAAALIFANSVPDFEIVGVSATAGNVPLKKTLRNALALREFMGAAWPVYRGAEKPWLRPAMTGEEFHGENGLGGYVLPEPTHSQEPEMMWNALYAAANRYPQELTVVTLGPLTDLATAFSLYPTLPKLLKGVATMGGAAVGGNCTPCSEYNIYADPDAAQAVLRSGVPLVLCGLDVTEKAYLTEAELEVIAQKGGKNGTFLREVSRSLLAVNQKRGAPGWLVHDVCPLLYLVAPEIFSAREAGVFVETQAELTLGKTVTDLWSDKKFGAKNATVVLDIDRSAFVRHMTDAFRAG